MVIVMLNKISKEANVYLVSLLKSSSEIPADPTISNNYCVTPLYIQLIGMLLVNQNLALIKKTLPVNK